jgi:hypothetical protein
MGISTDMLLFRSSYSLVRSEFSADRKCPTVLISRFLIRPCPAWQRRASACGRALLPHADKDMFVCVLELCKSKAKRAALRETNVKRSSLGARFDVLYDVPVLFCSLGNFLSKLQLLSYCNLSSDKISLS